MNKCSEYISIYTGHERTCNCIKIWYSRLYQETWLTLSLGPLADADKVWQRYSGLVCLRSFFFSDQVTRKQVLGGSVVLGR